MNHVQAKYIARRLATRKHSSLSLGDKGSDGPWKVALGTQGDYWKGYLSARPTYDTDFYHIIYDYHTQHSTSSSFSLAHDVGAGPGHVSRELASRFSHVVVSDNDMSTVDYARWNLSPTAIAIRSSPFSSQFSYMVSGGEELWQIAPPKSADLIVWSLVFPLMNTTTGMVEKFPTCP
jgi:trans-aconitate 3-methyltransferase